jgi:hypothetical protein
LKNKDDPCYNQAANNKYFAAVLIDAVSRKQVARQVGERIHPENEPDERRRSAQGQGERGQDWVLRVQIEKSYKHEQIQPDRRFHGATPFP